MRQHYLSLELKLLVAVFAKGAADHFCAIKPDDKEISVWGEHIPKGQRYSSPTDYSRPAPLPQIRKPNGGH